MKQKEAWDIMLKNLSQMSFFEVNKLVKEVAEEKGFDYSEIEASTNRLLVEDEKIELIMALTRMAEEKDLQVHGDEVCLFGQVATHEKNQLIEFEQAVKRLAVAGCNVGFAEFEKELRKGNIPSLSDLESGEELIFRQRDITVRVINGKMHATSRRQQSLQDYQKMQEEVEIFQTVFDSLRLQQRNITHEDANEASPTF